VFLPINPFLGTEVSFDVGAFCVTAYPMNPKEISKDAFLN
jgi:hypothetical protein